MRYLKRFNESQESKFCGECGTKLNKSDAFCDECGMDQDFSQNETITVDGKIEATYPNGQKTPSFILSSNNKTLSGTPISFDKSINKYDIPVGKEVKLTGTTKDGKSPKFNNPLYVSKKEDIKLI
jgi:hypothetical protein